VGQRRAKQRFSACPTRSLHGGQRAPVAILALGFVFAATHLIDALVLGIRPLLFALLAAIAAVLAALVLARAARIPSGPG